MVKLISKCLFFCLFILSFHSCTIEEGEGGTSSIAGKIFVRDLDSDGFLQDEYFGPEWPVYIVYGDDDIYSDRMDTHYDGSFRFEALFPGNYTIFAYSKCFTCPGEFEVIKVEVALDRDEDIFLEDIVVVD